MGDGLKYLFEIDAKAPGLPQVNRHLKESGEHMKHAGHEAEALSHKIRHEFGSVGHSVAYVKTELKELGEIFGVVFAFELLEKLAEKIKELGEELLHTSAKAESLGFSLKLNLGAGPGKEIEEWAERISKIMPVTGEQLKGVAVRLSQVGVPFEKMNRYVAAAADVAARSANKAEAFTDAMNVLSRMAITGKVSARSLVGLNLPAENFKFLPGFEGLNKQQILKKLQDSNSEINAEDVFRAITGGKNLGALGKQMGGLMETTLKNVSTLPEQYFEQFANSPSFEPLKAKLNDMYKSLDPSGPQGKEILAAFTGIVGDIVDGVKQIDFKEVAHDVRDVLSSLREIVGVMKTMVIEAGKIAGIIHGENRVVKAVHDYTPLGGLTDVNKSGRKAREDLAAQGRLPSQQEFKGVAGSAANFLNRYTPIGYINDTLANPDWWKGLMAKPIDKGAAQGLKGNGSEAKGAGADVASQAAEGYRQESETHSPSRVFERLGAQTVDGYVRGVRSGRGAIEDAIDDMLYVPPPRAAGAGGGRGAVTLTIGGITVHVDAKGQEAADVTAAAIEQALRARMISLLEQINAEAGA